MFLCLHSLGQRLYPHTDGAANDIGEQLSGLRVMIITSQEYQIKFQHIKCKFRQYIQRGVSASEIIDPHMISRIVQLLRFRADQIAALI